MDSFYDPYHMLSYCHVQCAFPLPAVEEGIHKECGGGKDAAIFEAVVHANVCLMSSQRK